MSDDPKNLLYFKRLDTLGTHQGQAHYLASAFDEMLAFARRCFEEQGRGLVMLDLDSAVNPGNHDPRLIIGRHYKSQAWVEERLSFWPDCISQVRDYYPEIEFVCVGRSDGGELVVWTVGKNPTPAEKSDGA